jgi:hypothetical protein
MSVGGVVFLIPWIAVLATSLSDHHSARQWRLAWSGFDVGLTLAFAFALAHGLLRQAVHYVWHLEGREHPVPPLRKLPMIFLPAS